MNCHECNEQLVPYFEGLLDRTATDAVAGHLDTCDACRATAGDHVRLRDRLAASGKAFRDAGIEENVMDRIFREQAHSLRGKKARKRPSAAMQILTAAAAILVLAFLWYVGTLPDDGTEGSSAGKDVAFGPKVDDWLLFNEGGSPPQTQPSTRTAPRTKKAPSAPAGTANPSSGGGVFHYNSGQGNVDIRGRKENLFLPGDAGAAMDDTTREALWRIHNNKLGSLGYGGGGGSGGGIRMSNSATPAPDATILTAMTIDSRAVPTAGAALRLAGDESLPVDSYGFSVGGAKDVDSFRRNVEAGFLPLPTDISVEGLYYDYYFDTSDTYECDDLFYPSYCAASTRDPFTKKPEYYLTVGLNSGMKSLERKKLNVMIVLDVSGSMESTIAAYHYDGKTASPAGVEGAPKQKIRAATESILGLLDHLREGDRFGMVVFSDNGRLAKPLRLLGETDMPAVRGHIAGLGAEGSTNLSDGLRIAFDQYTDFATGDAGDTENRVIVLTDAMPNQGNIDDASLLALMKDQAEKGIYTTFLGIGIDFNSSLVHGITTTRGANYFSIQSSHAFKQRLTEEFDLLVTPLVFDLGLTLESSGYRIDRVFGSPGVDRATGSIMKIDTLFPSRRVEKETRGGVVLLKLARKVDAEPSDDEICLAVTFEDRFGRKHRSSRSIRFRDLEPDHFDNRGVRKAVLLARYANLLQGWLVDTRAPGGPADGTFSLHDDFIITREKGIMDRTARRAGLGRWERQSRPLTLNDHYRQLFTDFRDHFKGEMKEIDDASLYREVMILDRLVR